jgi:HD superfamily phosphohydrolase
MKRAEDIIIRDVIHGDIVLPEKYHAIIRTREFQRLMRIKQLALTSFVFPNANHTRFEHSLGTYHIMCLVVEHFQNIFQDYNIFASVEDADVAKLAALLHDVGHGPFSHAFESVCDIHHEKWTEQIILDSDTELHQAIVNHFGKEMPKKVADCINARNYTIAASTQYPNFTLVYAELVSGALDVDRMDYILRDAYYTASRFGAIDLTEIIAAIRLTSIQKRYRLCFDETKLSYLEQLVFSRYEMYNDIYFKNEKVLIEVLSQKIMKRAKEVRDNLSKADYGLLDKIVNGTLSTWDYTEMDDYTMFARFIEWQDFKSDGNDGINVKGDPVLSFLCRSLVAQKDFEVITGIPESDMVHNELSFRVRHILADAGITNPYSFVTEIKRVEVYPDSERENAKRIRIQDESGKIYDYATRSHLTVGSVDRHYLFWSSKLLRLELETAGKSVQKAKVDDVIKQVENCIDSFKPSNHIEIEKKYLCNKEVLKKLEELAKDDGKWSLETTHECFHWNGGFSGEWSQIDTYFDTDDGFLKNHQWTLRIRVIVNREQKKYVCTIKKPVENEGFGRGSPIARHEYELEGDSSNITATIYSSFLKYHLADANVSFDLDRLKPIITIFNKRRKANIVQDGSSPHPFRCEVCLDAVEFRDSNDVSYAPLLYQIEIELASEYLTHITLNKFTDFLEHRLKEDGLELTATEESKLDIGLKQITSWRSQI